jgi:predicted Zn-dependent protease with MMP-like domain
MDVRIEDEQFEDWVLEAIDALPQAFRERLGSVAIVVAEWPTAEQLRSVGAHGLYGLYSGVPRNVPGADWAPTPSRITIFRGTIEQHARTPEAMRAKVIDTVHHEIAHHFGISDARLGELARERHGTQAGG